MSEHSFNSFFDRTDTFEFAKNEEKLAKQNFFRAFLFQNTVLQSSEINGYILLKVNKKLPEGKIFLRIETSVTKNLDSNLKNNKASDQLDKLKAGFKKSKNQEHPAGASNSMVLTWRKLSEFPSMGPKLSDKEKNPVLEFDRQALPKLRNTYIEKQKSTIPKQLFRSTVISPPIYEFEIFKLEKSIEKMTFMVLPFRISLDGKVPITTSQSLLDFLETVPGRVENKQKKLLPLEIGNVFNRQAANTVAKLDNIQSQHFNESDVERKNALSLLKRVTTEHQGTQIETSGEFVSIQNTLIAYYVTSSTFTEGQVRAKENPEERFKIYETKENFCQARIDLTVLPDYLKLNLRNCTEQINVSVLNKTITISKETPSKLEIKDPPLHNSKTFVQTDNPGKPSSGNMVFKENTMNPISLYDKMSREDPAAAQKASKNGFRTSLTRNLTQPSLRPREQPKKPEPKKKASGCRAYVERLKSIFFKNPAQNYGMSVSLDKTSFSNLDSTLNFVIQFDYDLVDSFQGLDAIICSRMQYKLEDADEVTIERILIHEYFALSKRMPRKRKPAFVKSRLEEEEAEAPPRASQYLEHQEPEVMEFLNKINISEITTKYQSINMPSFKLEFFIEFYASPADEHFCHKLMSSKINFLNIPFDYMIYSREHISFLFESLESACKLNENCVMLPYGNINLSADYETEFEQDNEPREPI